MTKGMNHPKVLYKYRPFNARTLKEVLEDRVWYADPSTFNDPLDTQPIVEADGLTNSELEGLVERMVAKRLSNEMERAARSIKYSGERTAAHITKESREQARGLIVDLRYGATDPEYGESKEKVLQRLLCAQICRELLSDYDRGILSLAESQTCPLMWSHYASEHQGICLGYAVDDDPRNLLLKVDYRKGRVVSASQVALLIDGREEVRREVEEAVLARKARQWGYEREWRVVGQKGAAVAPYDLVEIYFGIRCDLSVQLAVCRALELRGSDLKMYSMHRAGKAFALKPFPVDLEDLSRAYENSARDIQKIFSQVPGCAG